MLDVSRRDSLNQTMAFDVRHYQTQDEPEVVSLWNKCLQRDEISPNTFRRKIILDENFDERGCLVAVEGNQIVGFLLSIRRRYPYYDLGLESGKGWITAFFVHPSFRRKSVASAMIQASEEFLRREGIRTISISDYTPNYVMPGVDIDAYAGGFEFLKSHGYEKVQNVYGMGRSLVDVYIPDDVRARFQRLEEAGFSVAVFKPHFTLKVLEFLRKNYPGDLFRVALERIKENPECDEILLALKDGEVVGFSHFLDERFGPFGIEKQYMGRGLGPMLYYQTVEQMRKKGKQNLWLAWTEGRTKDFYYKVGLKVMRRHVIMEKALTNGKGGAS
jgi:mycothiol synthase